MEIEAPLLTPAALLAAIVDSSEDAIVSKNLDTIVTSWNKSAERIFGYTADEMVGQSISRLFPVDRLQEEAQILARIVKGERVEHFETVRVRKDGSPIDVSLTISPIKDFAGIVVGASKIAREITQQKAAARQLIQAHAQLQQADRLKAEFLATLSHELRTPLTAILGWVQILKEAATPEEIEQGVEVIERNVRLQSKLIEDLLDISRIESGKVSLDIQRLEVVGVVDAVMESVRPTAESKKIRLTSAMGNVSGTVMADKNRLQQVIWNLLTNAIKFTPAGGRIHVVVNRQNSDVEIVIADNGRGIPPEFLEHVFDRFRQADASTTRKFGGLGLGLTIAKHLTELQGGHLQATSSGVDQGATFTIVLPLMSAHRAPEIMAAELRNTDVDEAAAGADLTGVKVLAVDDEADCAAVVSHILTKNGADVRTAHCMEEALTVFADFSPDVILSDVGMPMHDGYELITRIRALPGGRAVPAVALTALARSEDRNRALRAGFQMHVAKPVDAHELVAVVQNLASLKA